MEVISLEEGRIVYSGNLVYKLSSEEEYNTLIVAGLKVSKLPNLCINNKQYKISTPKAILYSDGKICMSRCYGDNLELILRDMKSHKEGVEYINGLFKCFIENNFYWKDFAPRNIMIDNDVIYIMDFERGLGDENLSINDYLVDIVYEEYSAFLLPSERLVDVNSVYQSLDSRIIVFDNIKSRRVRNILRLTHGEEDVTYKDYLFAIKSIVICETPYIENGVIKYPILELEEYMKQNGVEKYARKIVGESNEKRKDL